MRIAPCVRSLVFTFVVLAVSAASFAQVGISITIGPPPLPVYEQPLCPDAGYLWTPGYWAYDYDIGDYYWVPGTWVLAPQPGFLWTPGWWGWGGSAFIFHEGYWGPTVGFYGGIVYGFGYFGTGYEGGRWQNGQFFYNRTVNNVNVTNIHNTYNTTVINNTTVNRVSYNGGSGGVTARPTPAEEAAANERHIPPVAAQTQNAQAARNDPQQRASVNHGKPAVAATPKPGEFKSAGAVPAKEAGGPYTPPANRGKAAPTANEQAARPQNNVPRPPTAVHPNDLPPVEKAAPPKTGDPDLDKKYQQQQEEMSARQNKERQQLQQQQDQEHQNLARENADEAKKQQVEQQHQQQTQQLQQRHVQEQQQMKESQQPARPK